MEVGKMTVAIENILSDIIRAVTSPYTDLLGDWFWAIVFMTIIGGIYIKSEHPGPAAVMMIVIGTLMAGVLDTAVRYVFAIFAAAGVASIIYILYRGHD